MVNEREIESDRMFNQMLLTDAEKAFMDRVWPRLQNGCYRAHGSIPVEIRGLNFNEFVRDGLCAVLSAAPQSSGTVKALDEDDYEEIISAAAINMRKATSGVRGQLITVQDSLDWWVMKETERRILSSLTAGKPEQPETVESVLLDAVRKIASTDLSRCGDMTTAEIFGALSRMHETARVAVETAERILGRDDD